MATIAAGQLAGLSRPAALEFSFFLSIPTMLAATGYDLLKTLHGSANAAAIGPSQISPHGWVLLVIGAVISFIVALAVVAWFMNWVRTRGFAPFAVYRIFLGAGVLLWLACS
jgi:undecaprenyl-diphosphatase